MSKTMESNTIREHAASLPNPYPDLRMPIPEHASRASEVGHIRHYDDETPDNQDHSRDEAWRNRFEQYY